MTDRAAWLEWRRGGVGGSDIATLVPGTSPWGSPYALWWDKTGLGAEPDDETETMRWGRLLEGAVLDEFSARTGLTVVGRQSWCEHPKWSWARCTPDGFAVEGPPGGDVPLSGTATAADPRSVIPLDALGVVQAKCSGWPADWAGGDMPDHVLAQVQWEMFVTGLPVAFVAVLVQGRRLEIREITRDEGIIGPLFKLAQDFWVNHVENQNPPDTDGSKWTERALADAYRHAVVGIELPVDDIADKISELRQLKAEQSALKTQIKAIEAKVKQALGPAEAGTVGDHVAVTWKEVTSHRLDTKALEVDHPALVREYRKPSTTRVFLVKKEAMVG